MFLTKDVAFGDRVRPDRSDACDELLEWRCGDCRWLAHVFRPRATQRFAVNPRGLRVDFPYGHVIVSLAGGSPVRAPQ